MAVSIKPGSLVTKEEFDALSPRMQGYAAYMFGARPGAGEHLKRCPYPEGHPLREEFELGEFSAMRDCEELEE